LKGADLGIDDLSVNKKILKTDKDFGFPEDMPKEVKDRIKSDLRGKEAITVSPIHFDIETGEPVPFSWEDESKGTSKIFEHAGLFLNALKYGKVLIIDELESCLHAKLLAYIIKIFNNSSSNPNNAQLIFTTHSTIPLRGNLMRRDQVWFVDKQNSKTKLYPLKKAKGNKVVRKGENLESMYLAGEYGAVPQFNDIQMKLL